MEINKSDFDEEEFVHPQKRDEGMTPFAGQHAHLMPRFKAKSRKVDETSDEAKQEEAAELSVCGAKCRKIPESIRATFIHTMFDD